MIISPLNLHTPQATFHILALLAFVAHWLATLRTQRILNWLSSFLPCQHDTCHLLSKLLAQLQYLILDLGQIWTLVFLIPIQHLLDELGRCCL